MQSPGELWGGLCNDTGKGIALCVSLSRPTASFLNLSAYSLVRHMWRLKKAKLYKYAVIRVKMFVFMLFYREKKHDFLLCQVRKGVWVFGNEKRWCFKWCMCLLNFLCWYFCGSFTVILFCMVMWNQIPCWAIIG